MFVKKKNMADPCMDGFAITPADVDLAKIAVGLYVGTGGDVVLQTYQGTTLTFKNVASGSILPIVAIRVAAATNAARLIGLL